jgi:hypothetical protein
MCFRARALVNPLVALQECYRIVRRSLHVQRSVMKGKWFLELSAFQLGLSPKDEMDDHKTLRWKDLWPFLVRSGFLLADSLFSHKLTEHFAPCTK